MDKMILAAESADAMKIAAMIADAGHDLNAIERKSRATMDDDGCHPAIEVLPGLLVKWVSNPNYQGGKRNGYGPGLYAVGRVKCVVNTWLLRQA